MNREQRRKRAKQIGTAKPKYSLEDVQRAMNVAIQIRKLSKGHLFKKTLNDQCVFCGAGMDTKKMCDYWFVSYLDRLQVVLINPDHFKDDALDVLWVQDGEEYKDVKVPLNVQEY